MFLSPLMITDPSLDYVAQRETFGELKKGLVAQIETRKSEISDLEKKIKEARPKTPNGKTLCRRCDTISMKYLYRTPQGGLSGGNDVYQCEICNNITEDTLSLY